MQQSMTSLVSATSRSAVPLTAVDEMSTTGDGILMKGKLLCAIYMKWFSRRVSMSEATQEHLRLRQTRLSWRQFEAVLRHDRLQLYLVTVSGTKKTMFVIQDVHCIIEFGYQNTTTCSYNLSSTTKKEEYSQCSFEPCITFGFHLAT